MQNQASTNVTATDVAPVRPVFFVQNNYVAKLTIPVAMHARARGIALEDRSSHASFDPDNCGIYWAQYDLVLPYGSVQFIRHLKNSTLSRFVLHDESRFATSFWAGVFGADALNGSGRLVCASDVFDILTRDGARHLRPDSVDKAFDGGVYDGDQWAGVLKARQLDPNLACWISAPRVIEAEWRCWVVGGEVVEISRYRWGGQMDVDREPVELMRYQVQWLKHEAQVLADIYLPAPCVVMDIAQTEQGYSVIEFNPIHCSGWYAADVSRVLDAWMKWAMGPGNISATENQKTKD